ncbi:MAG TPA: SCO family protein, partial [Bacillota bacterium]|nr:SCO family protein [Bacillota bacterium]
MMRPTQGDRAAVDCRLPIADCRLEAGVPELGRAASPRQPGRTRLNVRGGLGEPALPAHARYRYAIGFLLVSFLLVFCPPAQALSDTTLAGISFEQKLNTQVSLDLPFRDEAGNPVRLGNYFGHKPVILVLGYYECPMLCSLVLNGMVESLEDLKWSIGNQFEVVNISINPRESPALAAAKKRNYLKRYGRAGAEPGWHFLTGEEPAIQRLADEVGFQYAYDAASRQYAHPSGLIILTPEGKVARYFFGVTFASSEVYAALKAASGNQIGS